MIGQLKLAFKKISLYFNYFWHILDATKDKNTILIKTNAHNYKYNIFFKKSQLQQIKRSIRPDKLNLNYFIGLIKK